MRKRVRPTLKLSMLSYAVAAAFSGGAAQAAPVDLCSGLTSISVSTSGGHCSLDTAGAALTVTSSGVIDLGVAASVADASMTNNGGVITQSDSDYRSSTGYVTAYASAAAIDVSGNQTAAISNSGTISASASATVYAYGYSSGSSGSTSYYSGTANAQADAIGVRVGGSLSAISNSGTISASSSVYAWANSYTSYETASARAISVAGELTSLNNSGSIEAAASGARAYAEGIYGGSLGTITNTADGSITAYVSEADSAHATAIGGNELTGTLTNEGYIGATAFGSYYADAMAVLIAPSSSSSGPALAATTAGAIVNSGEIYASASTDSGSSFARGIQVYGDFDADITNTGTGSISASAGGSYANVAAIALYGDYSGTLTNSGSVSATAEGYNAYANGIDAGDITGSISNSGNIEAAAWGNYADARGMLVGEIVGSVVNDGELSGYADGYYTARTEGLSARNGLSGSLTNSEVISATSFADGYASAAGIVLFGGYFSSPTPTAGPGGEPMTGTLLNSGDVSAYAMGSEASALGAVLVGSFDGTLTNSGELSAAARGKDFYDTSSSSGGGSNSASALGLLSVGGLSGTVTNNGLISADAAGYEAYAYGVLVEGELSGSITVGGTGAVSAFASGYYADAVAFTVSELSGTGSLVNNGDILAEVGGFQAYGKGIDVEEGFAGKITNNELIDVRADGYVASAIGVSFAGESSTTGPTLTVISEPGNLTGSFVNNGEVSVTATGYYAQAGGVISDGYFDGTLTNAGTIAVMVGEQGTSSSSPAYTGLARGISLEGLGGSLTNSGEVSATLLAQYGSAVGISAGTVDGTVSNSGEIHAMASVYSSGQALGLSANEVYGSLSNSGTVEAVIDAFAGGAVALRVGYLGADAKVSNAGSLYAEVDASYGAAVGMQLGYLGGAASNSGEIAAFASGYAPDARGANVDYLEEGGTFSNGGKIEAYVSANYADATGLYVSYLGGDVNNSGSIRAEARSTSSYSGYAYGVRVGGLFGTLNNSGSISVAGGSNVSTYALYVSAGSGQVNNSGVIDGNVYVGDAVAVNNTGSIMLSPGDNAYINGNYTQSGEGRVVLNVSDAASAPTLYVDGTADLTGSSHVHVVVAQDNTLASGDVLAEVVSAGTLELSGGQYSVSDNTIFWNFTQSVDEVSNALSLTANELTTQDALEGSGLNDSQVEMVDEVMGDLNGGSYSELAQAFFNSATPGEAAEVMKDAGPVLPGAAGNAARAATTGATLAISARLGAKRGGSSGDAFTSNAVWLKPFVGQAEQDSVGTADGYDVDSAGFVLGIDGDVSDAWRVGVAVASSKSDVSATGSSMDVDSLLLATYGTYALSDTTSLDMDLAYVDNGYDSSRHVDFAGSTARGSYDGQQLAFGLTLTGQMKMGERVTFEPSLMARYNRVSIDSYSETGAGAYNLDVASTKEDSLLWAAKGAIEAGLGKGFLLANVGLGYDTLDAASVTTSFAGAGPTFVSNGIKPESTVLFAGVGYRYVTQRNLEIDAMYDIENRGDFTANTASLKFKLPF